ncbi:glycoside hydrolase family 88 protein, partial [Bacillus amyloliquefaciens]
MVDTKQILDKQHVIVSIERLMENLASIKDQTGEYLLHFDGVVVDDKSWEVWNWPQGVGLYGIYNYWKISNDQKAKEIMTEWYKRRLTEGVPPKNVNTMAPLLTLAYLYEDTKDQTYLPYLEAWADWVLYEMPRT